MSNSNLRPETIAAHALRAIDEATGAVVPPIYTSTTYARDESYTPKLKENYVRNGNPTLWQAEETIAALEQGAAALLKPGGRLLLLDVHPLYCMGESFTPLVLDFPYVNDGPRHFEGSGSYANPDADLPWSIAGYAWSIGETVHAAIGAGMTIVRLDEHVASASDPRGDCMTREPDGLFRLRAGRGGAGALPEPLPVLFTLVAERPGPRGTLSEDEPVG